VDSINILVAGVGGQGIITFGKILCEVCNRKGIRILMAETHGLSQRGGGVVVHLRIGDIYNPLIPLGGADAIVSMEFIEAFRNLRYLGNEGVMLINSNMIRPPLPRVKTPDKALLLDRAKSLGIRYYIIDADRLAVEAGSILSQNMVMLGGLMALDILPEDLNIDDFVEVIGGMRMGDINIRAFEYGYHKVKDLIKI
jgi:indolepyruvate ferredoxin oxidoreductase beta subunit